MAGPRRDTYGRLLLFAVLLLGVLTMHTLGHPSEQGSGSVSPVGVHLSHEVAVAQPHESVGAATAMPSMSGMDPASVCLAVLGTFTLLLLLTAAYGGTGRTRLVPPRPSRLLQDLWPHPPPPGHLLSRLSVLRI
ncbi:DUF6153 family protein [Streptomyces cylindrosporus]|uniref:DUF6153 family protein n=1 Tax=Streptomyces cylindrosporus TaxID=2927583 RepID=A0ABS9Y0G4_9ACTN|nr:DUF6153 family protein [Streptomyces cylindrosporus]MCI3270176.1 DUF6153 family protein [Streptomyces cylindrosporus]